MTYEWTGRALREFEYCKIGLNIHHGVAEHLGRPYSIRTQAGSVDGRFEADIVPQLVENGTLTAMTPYFDQLTVHVDGAEATFDFVGDLFELQDHRNWADANWKTYGTPLAFGFPATLPRGETLHQSVRISIAGDGAGVREGVLPSCWVSDAADPRAAAHRAPVDPRPPGERTGAAEIDAARITSGWTCIRRPIPPRWFGLHHVRASMWDCHLEVAVFLRPDAVQADIDKAATAVAEAFVAIDRILVLQSTGGFSEFGGAAPAAMAECVADSSMSAGAILAGTPQSFNDLNRDRPDYSRIDGVVFALNPQVHAADDVSMMQNTRSIPAHRRLRANGCSGASTSRCRRSISSASTGRSLPGRRRSGCREPGPAAVDAVRRCLDARGTGRDGGMRHDVGHAVRAHRRPGPGRRNHCVALGRSAHRPRRGHGKGAWSSAGTSDPDSASPSWRSATARLIRVFVANLTAEPQRCTLHGIELSLQPYEVVLRDVVGEAVGRVTE